MLTPTLMAGFLTVASATSYSNTIPTYSAIIPCTVTNFTDIPQALAVCKQLTLKNIFAPSGKSLNLTAAQTGAVITFAGTTTFGFTNSSSFSPIVLGGTGVTITAEPGAIIDGNGPAYWDGMGSNGGVPKPNQFVLASKMKSSIVENLTIRNYPVHCFMFRACNDLIVRNIKIDNSYGNAPNDRSGTKAAAHNSDGFGFGDGTQNVVLSGSAISNQDDCVAVTSGNNITVENMWCSGGHGISIGSVGGKAYNNVTNIMVLLSSPCSNIRN